MALPMALGSSTVCRSGHEGTGSALCEFPGGRGVWAGSGEIQSLLALRIDVIGVLASVWFTEK